MSGVKRLLVVAALGVSLGGAWAGEIPPAPGAPRLVKPRAVKTAARDEVTGALFPTKMLPLGFEVGGRLFKVRVQKGDRVKEGQVLAQLDSEIVDAQVQQAEAQVAAAEAASDIAKDVAERNEKLLAEGSVSDIQSKGASTTAKQAAAQVLAARAGLAQALAARRRHDLKAGISGVVIDAPDQAGMTIGPGMPLFVIQQVDTLTLKATVAESVRNALKPGQKVRVASTGGSAVTDDAVVKVILPSADPQTRRIPIEINVPNADGRFVANTLARAVLPVGSAQSALAIPSTALGTAGGEHVILAAADGTMRKVPVTVVERSPLEVVIQSPEPLDRIVEYPNDDLVLGSKAAPKP